MTNSDAIRKVGKENCISCGSHGNLLYVNLRDRLFGAPGEWNIKKCSNENCGMLWIDPAPVEEDLHKLYRNYYTHESTQSNNGKLKKIYDGITQAYINRKYGYTRSVSIIAKILSYALVIHPGRRADADAKIFHLPYKSGGDVLEIGCGDGTTLKFLSKQGWNCTGIDFDDAAARKAREKGLEIYTGKLEEQNFESNRFDAIVMSHVIEHVPDPAALLIECKRLLKPGGTITCYTPNAKSMMHSIYKEYWRGLEPPRHLNIFTKKSLHAIFQKSGYRIVNCQAQCRSRRIISSSFLSKHSNYQPNNTSLILKVASEIAEIIEGMLDTNSKSFCEELFLQAKTKQLE